MENQGWLGVKHLIYLLRRLFDRAMAQAVSRQPLTAEAHVRSRVSPCGICRGQSGTGTGFSPSISGFPCQFHSTGDTLKWKSRKKNLMIFLTGLHNKPSRLRCVRSICCGALQLKKTAYSIPLSGCPLFEILSNASHSDYPIVVSTSRPLPSKFLLAHYSWPYSRLIRNRPIKLFIWNSFLK
jgi:hypothetical protein